MWLTMTTNAHPYVHVAPFNVKFMDKEGEARCHPHMEGGAGWAHRGGADGGGIDGGGGGGGGADGGGGSACGRPTGMTGGVTDGGWWQRRRGERGRGDGRWRGRLSEDCRNCRTYVGLSDVVSDSLTVTGSDGTCRALFAVRLLTAVGGLLAAGRLSHGPCCGRARRVGSCGSFGRQRCIRERLYRGRRASISRRLPGTRHGGRARELTFTEFYSFIGTYSSTSNDSLGTLSLRGCAHTFPFRGQDVICTVARARGGGRSYQ